jgi:hypothetical protein
MFGIVIGYFTVKVRKLGTFVIGGWLGYIISLVIYSAFVYKIETNPAELGLYVTNFVMIIIMGGLSVILYD